MGEGRGGDRKSGRPHGKNAVKYHKTCEWCSKPFTSARPDARYDTPTCRSRAHRAIKKAEARAQRYRDIIRKHAGDDVAREVMPE